MLQMFEAIQNYEVTCNIEWAMGGMSSISFETTRSKTKHSNNCDKKCL